MTTFKDIWANPNNDKIIDNNVEIKTCNYFWLLKFTDQSETGYYSTVNLTTKHRTWN